jgi:hypothetical protein
MFSLKEKPYFYPVRAVLYAAVSHIFSKDEQWNAEEMGVVFSVLLNLESQTILKCGESDSAVKKNLIHSLEYLDEFIQQRTEYAVNGKCYLNELLQYDYELIDECLNRSSLWFERIFAEHADLSDKLATARKNLIMEFKELIAAQALIGLTIQP